jgi:ATP synthase protein I
VKKDTRLLAEASSLGLMFPLAIGIGFGWGWWMDRFFGTYPWLTAIFTGFGLIAGFVNLFRFAARSDDSGEKGEGEGSGPR